MKPLAIVVRFVVGPLLVAGAIAFRDSGGFSLAVLAGWLLIWDGVFALIARRTTSKMKALNIAFVVGMTITASALTTLLAKPHAPVVAPSLHSP
jgi:hypothetical protein